MKQVEEIEQSAKEYAKNVIANDPTLIFGGIEFLLENAYKNGYIASFQDHVEALQDIIKDKNS